ncbi:LysE family translocator [Streptomyces sp. NPDC001515]
MAHPYAVLGFLTALLPLVATPGASLALLLRHVTDHGRRQALPVVLGTVTGLYVHAGLAMAGLAALLMRSPHAFTAVTILGAAYLIGLGLWTWHTTIPRAHPPTEGAVTERTGTEGAARERTRTEGAVTERTRRGGAAATRAPVRRSLRARANSAYAQALLGNVLNPKAASIYLTLVPQFIDNAHPLAAQILTLATAHALLIALWLLGWALLVRRAAPALRSPRFARNTTRTTAVVLLALGIGTLTQR